MGIPDDATLGEHFRVWVDFWAQGARDEREELYEEIEQADRTGFPWQPAVAALAKLDARILWKTFDDTQLQDLYDWSHETGLPSAASRFEEAAHARPSIDDGKIPKDVFELVMNRDGRHCQDCGATDDLTIDHKITPWSEGGTSTDPKNLQVLCRSCNSRKGTHPWIPPVAKA
jgi:hypothetical protein